MSTIYVCTGSCHGQSAVPGTCQGDACELKGQPLQEMHKCDKCNAVYGLNETHACN